LANLDRQAIARAEPRSAQLGSSARITRMKHDYAAEFEFRGAEHERRERSRSGPLKPGIESMLC